MSTSVDDDIKKAFEDPFHYKLPVGITRFDFAITHAWWVRIRRDNADFAKIFSDGKYGSIDAALIEAIRYRHQIIESFPVTIRTRPNKQLSSDPEQRVKKTKDHDKGKDYFYYTARCYDAKHEVIFKHFSISKLGEDKARHLAIIWARDNHNYSDKPGVVIDIHKTRAWREISRSDVAVLSTINSRPYGSEGAHQKDPYGFEGGTKFVVHKQIERDKQVRNAKILEHIKIHGRLYCEICGFSFVDTYKYLPNDIIEVHHIRPLGTLDGKQKTSISDLILLCANCHLAVHQGDAQENLIYLAMQFNKEDVVK